MFGVWGEAFIRKPSGLLPLGVDSLVWLLIQGIGLGLAAAAPIGPVNVEIARRAIRRGFGAGASVGMGAVSVDVAYVAASAFLFAGANRSGFGNHPWVQWPLTLAAVGVLGFLGVMSLRGARQASREDLFETNPAPAVSFRAGYLTGVLMTALNPFTLAYWFVVLPEVSGNISEQPVKDLPIICSGVLFGTSAWVVFFAGLLGWAGRFARQRLAVAADVAGGILLLGFAALALWKAIGRVL